MKYTNLSQQPSSSQMALKFKKKIVLHQAGVFVAVLWLVFFLPMNMKCHLRSSNSKGFTNLYHTSLQLPVKVLEVLDPLFF